MAVGIRCHLRALVYASSATCRLGRSRAVFVMQRAGHNSRTIHDMTSRIFQLARATPFRAAILAPRVSTRTFVSSVARLESHAPIIQGEGTKDGEVASDEQQSTGLERFEILGRLQGVDVFGQEPVESDRVATVDNPIVVESLYPQRIVGCTGVPADSHETVWVRLEREGQRRCTSCGQGAFIFMLTSVPAQLCWPGT